MRDKVIELLIAGVPLVGGRVFQTGFVPPETERPYLIVTKGPEAGEHPFYAFADPVAVYIIHDQNALGESGFHLIDPIEAQVKAALDDKIVVDALGRRYFLSYDGNIGNDMVLTEEEGYEPEALQRAMNFLGYYLAWLNQVTLEPDPIVGLRTFSAKSYSEVQSITLTDATGGSFRLSYDGAFTGLLSYQATALQVQTALEALAGIGAGGIQVSGNPGGPYTAIFTGANAGRNMSAIGVDDQLTPADATIIAATLRSGQGLQTDPATWSPSDMQPGLYWRTDRIEDIERTNWGVWVTSRFRGHLVAPGDQNRLYWMRRIAQWLSAQGRIYLSDSSPMTVLSVAVEVEANPFTAGQIALTGRFGVKREQVAEFTAATARLNHATLTLATV